MQGPDAATFVASIVPFVLFSILWVGAIALAIWTVLLLRRIAVALETISASLGRMEPPRDHA